MVIGLTGGIGSGKSSILAFFKTLANATIYNADAAAKSLMTNQQTIRTKIKHTFGEKSYIKGVLNTAYIANIVFSNKEKLAALNAIVHPEVRKHFQQFIEQHKSSPFIVYENAILFESGSDQFCDVILLVHVAEKERIRRVMQRDAISKSAVIARMSNQWSDSKRALQAHYLIENTSLNKAKEQLKKIHNILTKKAHLI